jgi:hypothetical protein
MPSNSLVSRRGLLPRRLGDELERALQQVEARGTLEKRSDAVQIERAEEATIRGLCAVGQISALERTLVQAVPRAEGRLRAIADAGTVTIVGVVARSGF